MNLQVSKVQQCHPLQSYRETNSSHTVAGVQDGTPPTGKGVGISSETMCALTLGSSHPIPKNLLETKKHHSHKVIHC